MTTCEYCGEPKIFGFHLMSLVLGAFMGTVVFVILTVLGLAR